MFHYVIIGGLVLLVLACVVILCSIRPDDYNGEKYKLPTKTTDDRTHFYKAVSPDRGLPPVPVRKLPRHAAASEAVTDLIPIQGHPQTRAIPKIGYQR